MKRVLLLHQGFPSGLTHMVRHWASRPDWEVRLLGATPPVGLPPELVSVCYDAPSGLLAKQRPYLKHMESSMAHAMAAAEAMQKMKAGGFTPDVILANADGGESLYTKHVFPSVRLVHRSEAYQPTYDLDHPFDPEFAPPAHERARTSVWNALVALNLTQSDIVIAPTHWQMHQHPADFASKLHVQHEGLPTRALRPDPRARFTTREGVKLRAGDPVITFTARRLEPGRGFHVFVRALQRIQRAQPDCHAVIVGVDDGVSNAVDPVHAEGWRQRLLKEVSLDPARTHFVGGLTREQLVLLLQVSAAHVYLSHPLPIGRSLLLAMACGAPIVASDTAPVREVLWHQSNAQLVNFHSMDEIVAAVLHCLRDPAAQKPLREQAMQDAQKFSQEAGREGYEALLGQAFEPSAPSDLSVWTDSNILSALGKL